MAAAGRGRADRPSRNLGHGPHAAGNLHFLWFPRAGAVRHEPAPDASSKGDRHGAPSPELCNLWLARAFMRRMSRRPAPCITRSLHPSIDTVHGGSRIARGAAGIRGDHGRLYRHEAAYGRGDAPHHDCRRLRDDAIAMADRGGDADGRPVEVHHHGMEVHRSCRRHLGLLHRPSLRLPIRLAVPHPAKRVTALLSVCCRCACDIENWRPASSAWRSTFRPSSQRMPTARARGSVRRDHRCASSPLLFAARGRRSLSHSLPSATRAHGTPDARCVRSLVCESGEAHEHSHHGRAGGIRRSARSGVMACFASPPVSSAGTTVSRRHGLPRQDHATWAIRRSVVVRRVTRAPRPICTGFGCAQSAPSNAAARTTASRPATCDDREPPLMVERDR